MTKDRENIAALADHLASENAAQKQALEEAMKVSQQNDERATIIDALHGGSIG